jgi:hypothetical protein
MIIVRHEICHVWMCLKIFYEQGFWNYVW